MIHLGGGLAYKGLWESSYDLGPSEGASQARSKEKVAGPELRTMPSSETMDEASPNTMEQERVDKAHILSPAKGQLHQNHLQGWHFTIMTPKSQNSASGHEQLSPRDAPPQMDRW